MRPRKALTQLGKLCPITHCTTRISYNDLMCFEDLQKVPESLKLDIRLMNRVRGRGDPIGKKAYARACANAITAVESLKAKKTKRPTSDVRLDKRMGVSL